MRYHNYDNIAFDISTLSPIRILQNSQLFSRHPDLLRLTGVHLTVMNVIKSYLSFNTSLKSKNDHKISVRVERKKKITFAGVSYHDCNNLIPQLSIFFFILVHF